MQRFVWEIMKKSRVWNDFLKNMCSKDITQNLDLFGETLFFYPVANTFSQTGCQIPCVTSAHLPVCDTDIAYVSLFDNLPFKKVRY